MSLSTESVNVNDGIIVTSLQNPNERWFFCQNCSRAFATRDKYAGHTRSDGKLCLDGAESGSEVEYEEENEEEEEDEGSPPPPKAIKDSSNNDDESGPRRSARPGPSTRKAHFHKSETATTHMNGGESNQNGSAVVEMSVKNGFKKVPPAKVKGGFDYETSVNGNGSGSHGIPSSSLGLEGARRPSDVLERHLHICPSKIHGKGLFTRNPIPGGEVVVEYAGEILKNKKEALNRQNYYTSRNLDIYFMKLSKGDAVIDATIVGNCSRYINHSCRPNCEAEYIRFLNQPKVFIYSKRDISPGEELTYDYQLISDDLLECNCGSVSCRRVLNANISHLEIDQMDLVKLLED